MDSLKEETKERRSLASRLEHFSRNITSDIVSQAPFSLAAERMTKFFLALHPQKKKKKTQTKKTKTDPISSTVAGKWTKLFLLVN